MNSSFQAFEFGARALKTGGEEAAALGAKHDVLQNGEGFDQHEMLVDHPDPVAEGVLRAGDFDRVAIDQDLAGVGLVIAVDDAHQRRLTGAVLSDDSVDGAGGTANEMRSFAWTGPNHLSIPRSSRAGGASFDGAGASVSDVVTRRSVAYDDASLALNL